MCIRDRIAVCPLFRQGEAALVFPDGVILLRDLPGVQFFVAVPGVLGVDIRGRAVGPARLLQALHLDNPDVYKRQGQTGVGLDEHREVAGHGLGQPLCHGEDLFGSQRDVYKRQIQGCFFDFNTIFCTFFEYLDTVPCGLSLICRLNLQ